MAKYLDSTGLTYLWGKITAAFQTKVTASGLLKGDGSGGVTAATSGTDYQAPLTNPVTGTGTSGSLVKFNGTSTVTAATSGTDYQAPLPSQSGNNGKYLTTNGSALSWGSVTVPTGSSTSPAMDGTAAAGTETTWAHGDHVHPTDTSRQAKITASGILKGDGSGGVSAAVADTDYMAARSITNNTSTSTPLTANTNLITANTLRYHTNRTTSVVAADTDYSTAMARGIYAGTSPMIPGTTSLPSGMIYLQYDA